jgi:hypothetical protein
MQPAAFQQEQSRIRQRIAAALVVAAALFGLQAAAGSEPQRPVANRLHLWASLVAVNALWLVLAVGLLARRRFVNPHDMPGEGRSETAEAARLRALVQNTLEQFVLAAAAWAGWLFAGPASLGALVIPAALCFATGRASFSVGQRYGAAARAFGFALSFYPTATLLVWTALHILREAWMVRT